MQLTNLGGVCLGLALITGTLQTLHIPVSNLHTEVVGHTVITEHMITIIEHHTMSSAFLYKAHIARETGFFKLVELFLLVEF